MRIGGEQIMFVPQTGRLSGTEISVLQGEADASDGYIHSERRFKLITESNLGGWMPDGRLAVGDTYAIFGIKLPQTYIDIAESELFKEAIRVKYENEEQRFTFRGELDGIWAQNNWENVKDKLRIGGYVNFTDNHFQPNGTLIRISAITEYLHKPMQPEIELTNVVMGRGLLGELAKIPEQELVIEENEAEVRRLEMRRWRDVTELRSQIGNVFTEFSESINPATVSSMQIVAGSERGQFLFFTSQTGNIVDSISPIINFNSVGNTLSVRGNTANNYSLIRHLTLGIDALDGKTFNGSHNTQVRPISEYRSFVIPPRNFAGMLRDKLYWLYIKAPVDTSIIASTWELTTEAKPNFIEDGYYWLVVGALNSEYDGTRSFSRLFGYTEILPGQITTSMIRSTDGVTYFDLEAGEIAGKIKFLDGLISGHIGITNGSGDITAFIDGNNNPTNNIAFGAGGDGANAMLKILHDGNMSTDANITSLGSIISGNLQSQYILMSGEDGMLYLIDGETNIRVVLSTNTYGTVSWGDIITGSLEIEGDSTNVNYRHNTKVGGGVINIETTDDSNSVYSASYQSDGIRIRDENGNNLATLIRQLNIAECRCKVGNNFSLIGASNGGAYLNLTGLKASTSTDPPSGISRGDCFIYVDDKSKSGQLRIKTSD